MRIKQLFALGAAVILTAGCVTQKKMTYMRDAVASTADSLNAHFESKAESIIRIGDQLTIFVSALDKEAVEPYNLPTVIFATPGSNEVKTSPQLQSYTVDSEGNVNMPVLGKVHVAGLTRTGVEDAVRELLEKQVVNPSVQVNLVNAKVSVMGEVNHPSKIYMTGDRMTLLEALAQAGDLTPYGRRDNVLVTRELNGKLEMARVDLTSANLFLSPYYYLQHNDIIYVSPNKVRAISSANAGLWLSMVSTVASAATVIVTVVNATNPSAVAAGTAAASK